MYVFVPLFGAVFNVFHTVFHAFFGKFTPQRGKRCTSRVQKFYKKRWKVTEESLFFCPDVNTVFVLHGGLLMIKDVNRQVVEVQETDSDYFEKIMFFVKPEYASLSEGKIRERAGMIAAKAGSVPPTKVKRTKWTEAVKLAGALLAGVVLTLLFLAVSR